MRRIGSTHYITYITECKAHLTYLSAFDITLAFKLARTFDMHIEDMWYFRSVFCCISNPEPQILILIIFTFSFVILYQ